MSNKNKGYFFKIDKDKIILQLKSLIKKRRANKGITILILFFFLMGVAIAIYRSDIGTESMTEELNSRKEQIVQEEQMVQENIIIEEEPELEKVNEQKKIEQVKEQELTGVVTEALKPLRESSTKDINFIKPHSGEIIADQGWYYHPVFKDWRYQNGIIIKGQSGDIVMAVDSGKVVLITEDEYKGLSLKIDHDNGWETVYSHLDRVSVKKGEYIAKGQEVARLGDTGMTEQAILEFELFYKDKNMSPLKYFK